MSFSSRRDMEIEFEELVWRFEQLCAVGYDAESASELAARTEIDLGLAQRLLEDGCPSALAVRILC